MRVPKAVKRVTNSEKRQLRAVTALVIGVIGAAVLTLVNLIVSFGWLFAWCVGAMFYFSVSESRASKRGE